MNRLIKNTPKLLAPKAELEAYIERWLVACKSNGLSEQTTDEYQNVIGRFVWWYSDYTTNGQTLGYSPEAVTLDVLRQFVNYLREDQPNGRWGLAAAPNGAGGVSGSKAGLKPNTIRHYILVVRTFFNWLEEESYIEKTPFTKALKLNTSKRQQSRVIKTVASEDLAKIFETLNRPERARTYTGSRNLAMISFLLDTGVRRGELLSIRMSDFEKDRKRCKVRGKTGERFVFFSESTRKAVGDYIDEWRDEQSNNPNLELWLTEDGYSLSYPALGSIITQLEKASGVRFHLHQLRHTFATMLANSGVSAFSLMEMLGHGDIKTTQVYISNTPEMLQVAYRGAAPLDTLDLGKRRRGRPRRA